MRRTQRTKEEALRLWAGRPPLEIVHYSSSCIPITGLPTVVVLAVSLLLVFSALGLLCFPPPAVHSAIVAGTA